MIGDTDTHVNAQCEDCDSWFLCERDNARLGYQTGWFGQCPDCVRHEKTGLIYSVAQLEKCGRYAWPGGYPLVFMPPDGESLICFDCAKKDLENGDGPLGCDIEDGDQAYYGGVSCDGCDEYIVDPLCPECSDELFDGTPLVHSEGTDASLMHTRCAAKLVKGGLAERVPGTGIRIIAGQYPRPWYASVGTVYAYERR